MVDHGKRSGAGSGDRRGRPRRWRYGDNVRAVALDVTDERAAIAAVQFAVDAFGRLDVLVNNAADYPGSANAIL